MANNIAMMNIDKIKMIENSRPHVVILGAGATIATIPDGDKYGNMSSVMKGFLKQLHLNYLIDGIPLQKKSDNIEDIYSELYEKGQKYDDVRLKIENEIKTYFSKLQIPDNVTIYDLLILSLTSKDCIATFNWDPLLIQAYQRVFSQITEDLPELIFLHGNVAAGYCPQCGHFGALNRRFCNNCGTPYIESPLLFPVKHKDYSKAFISHEWMTLEGYLKRSKILTIFGYSGPKSDIDAIGMLTKAFEKYLPAQKYNLIEIIERKGVEYNMLSPSWKKLKKDASCEFNLVDSFFKSRLALYPRCTVEWLNKQNIDGCWGKPKFIFNENENWDSVKEKVISLA